MAARAGDISNNLINCVANYEKLIISTIISAWCIRHPGILIFVLSKIITKFYQANKYLLITIYIILPN